MAEELIKELNKNAEVPEWVNSEVAKITKAADAVKIPDWVDGEVKKLRDAADAVNLEA